MRQQNNKKWFIPVGMILALGVLLWWCLSGGQNNSQAEPEVEKTASKPLPRQTIDWHRHENAVPQPVVEEDEEDPDDGVAAVSTLCGRVISSEDGGAVKGAVITFEHDGRQFSTKSKSDGAFCFKAHEEGRYELLSAMCQGYQPFWTRGGARVQAFNAVNGLEVGDMVITLQPVGELSGRVVTLERDALPGARVCSVQHGVLDQTACAVSDENGAFTIMAPKMAMLEASHENYRSGRFFYHGQTDGEIVIIMGESIEGLELFSISGQVVDSQENPLVGVLVMASMQNTTPKRPPARDGKNHHVPAPATATTDGEGHFQIDKLEEGQYLVMARQEGYESATLKDIAVGSEDVKLVMGSGYKIFGQVTDGLTGAPVQSYTVLVAALGRRSRTQSVPVYDNDGHYEVGGLSQNTFGISIVAQGYAPTEERIITPFEEQAMEVNFELVGGGRVHGTIIDADSGEPIGGAIITAEAQRFSMRGAGGYHGRALSSPDGTFEFFGLPIGTRSLEVTAMGYNAKLVSGLEVSPGGDVGPLMIELSRHQEGQRYGKEITGIGAVLGKNKDGVEIKKLVDGSAAAAAGLKKGDVILEVDGTEAGGTNFRDVVEAIRGEEGSNVNLRVRHQDGSEETISITRAKFSN